ncbi:MAG: hypothetical protein K8R53_02645 [Bacteroidales bacterium]|nr:hypothetical protein [Bacteroidales bacterium]
MKTQIFIPALLILTFCFTGLFSQEDREPQYLLSGNDGQVHISGFGAPIIGFSSIEGNFAVINGGGGAVLFNQTFYIGGYGMGLSTQHKRNNIEISGSTAKYDDLYTRFGHGGFWLGYIHDSHKAVHFGFSTKLGWGSVSLTEQYNHDDYKWDNVVIDNVFVMNPQIEVELNLLKWFKMNVGAGYQFVAGIDRTYTNPQGNTVNFFESKDFNKPMVNLSLLFGGFGGKR